MENDLINEHELLKRVMIYCIESGDQKLWNLLYPWAQANKFIIYDSIIEQFKHKIG
jgi:hypothetical protein